MKIPIDKLLHVIAGLIIFAFSFMGAKAVGVEDGLALLGAFSVVTLAGIAKEIKDEIVYGGFDIYDLLWTIFLPMVFTGLVLSLKYSS